MHAAESAVRAMRLVCQAVAPADPLQARAARLWPDSDYLQREWLRAVRQVRRTRGGWLLERPTRRTT